MNGRHAATQQSQGCCRWIGNASPRRIWAKSANSRPFPGIRTKIGLLMDKYAEDLKLLVELDERHDELLRELDDLDKQVEAVLALWLAERTAARSEAA